MEALELRRRNHTFRLLTVLLPVLAIGSAPNPSAAASPEAVSPFAWPLISLILIVLLAALLFICRRYGKLTKSSGVLLIISAPIVFLLGIFLANREVYPEGSFTNQVGVALSTVTPVLLIAGIVVYATARLARNRVIGYLKAGEHGRVRVASVAARFKMLPQQVEDIVADAIAAGKLEGYLDEKTQEFVAKTAVEETVVAKPPTVIHVGGDYITGTSVKDSVIVRSTLGEKAVKKCRSCGRDIPAESLFCPECGSRT